MYDFHATHVYGVNITEGIYLETASASELMLLK